MKNPKCKRCNKTFKKSDYIIITDGKANDAVHEECHYEFLLNQHMNSYINLDELKEWLKEET